MSKRSRRITRQARRKGLAKSYRVHFITARLRGLSVQHSRMYAALAIKGRGLNLDMLGSLSPGGRQAMLLRNGFKTFLVTLNDVVDWYSGVHYGSGVYGGQVVLSPTR